jgi:hypothetical protein
MVGGVSDQSVRMGEWQLELSRRLVILQLMARDVDVHAA